MEEINFGEYSYYNGKIIDIETGEQLNRKDAEKVINDLSKNDHLMYSEIMSSIGGVMDTRLTSTKHGRQYKVINIKKDFDFIKTFNVAIKDMLEDTNLSFNSRAFMYTFQNYIHFPTNTIVIDYEHPTIDKICKVLGCGQTKYYGIIKELKNLDIIKEKKLDGRNVLYVNPFLHSKGLVDIDTYDLFEDSIYNPYNK